MATFQDFGANLLMGLGAGLNPQAATLLQRQRENLFARDEKAQALQRAETEKLQAAERLQNLIGTAGFEQAGPLQPGQAAPIIGGTGFAGQAGLNANTVEMLQSLAAASPKTALKGISEQIFKEGGAGEFKNVRVDDLGNAFGVKGGVWQQIPSSDPSHPFTKFKTVQGTTPKGLPTTELVNPAGLRVKDGRITIGKKVALPTQAEALKISQTESSLNIIKDIRSIMSSKNPPNLGSVQNYVNELKAGTGITGVLTRLATDPLTPNEAKLISSTQALSNQIIQAMRGAQVGPAEQEKFERQLPIPGQPKELFTENLKLSEQTLKMLNKRIAELRGFATTQQTDIGGGISSPTTQAAFNNLKSGERYINPADGKVYIKK